MSLPVETAFKLFSFGIAAENKPLSTKELLCVPIEIFPAMEGEIAEEPVEIKHKGKDSFGKEYEVSVKVGQSIPCKWLPWGSNRATAPDVRRGERVLIYRGGDSDEEFYWVSTGLDDHLRRLETVLWLFNANPDGKSDDPSTVENSYAFEVSTHKKLVTFRTTKLNGEPFTHVVQLNTGNGVFTYSDDVKNFIEVDSAAKKITLHNAAGTYWQLNDKDIVGWAMRDVTVDAKRNITFRCQNFSVIAKEKFDVQSQTSSIKAPGGITLDGPVKCTNTFESAGKATFKGAADVDGALEIKGTTKANGITSSKPISGPSATI